MKDSGVFSLEAENSEKVGRINFGTRPKEVKYYTRGNLSNTKTVAANIPMTWLVAGVDADGTLVLYGEEPMMSCHKLDKNSNSFFQTGWRNKQYTPENTDSGYGSTAAQTVYLNHWGASNLRAQAKALVGQYFTPAEQSAIHDTTITTKDTKNSVDYKTTDKLYVALCNGEFNYSSTITSITVGSQQGNFVIDKAYWAGRSWLRSPNPGSFSNALIVLPGDFVTYYNMIFDYPAVSFAFNLDLSSVIFASAASANLGSGVVEVPQASPMQLRLSSDEHLAAASIAADRDKLTYSAPAGSRLVILATTYGGKLLQYSQPISQTVQDETLTYEDIPEFAGTAAAARAWIEMDDPNSTQSQIKYATEPINIDEGAFDLTADSIVQLETVVQISGKDQKILVRGLNSVIPDGTKLVAKVVTNAEGLDPQNYEIEKQFHYEIELQDENGAPLPMPLSEKVELYFQVIDGLDKNDLEVVLRQIGDDIQFEEKLVNIDGNDYVCVKTDNFSPYSLIDKLSEEEKAAQNRAILFTVVGITLVLILAVGIFIKFKSNKQKLGK